MLAQQVLSGFEADAINPPLHFCDAVTLIPDSVNGLAAFAGAPDARAWVEYLEPSVAVPPNLRDCQWRLLPRRQYTESTQLKKIAKKGTWDAGKCLAWPDVPEEGDDLDALARNFMRNNQIEGGKFATNQMIQVKEVLSQLMATNEEHDGNVAEEERQLGTIIRYGDSVQMLHVSTQSFLCVSKTQAIEKGSKKVELVNKDEGNEHCIFMVSSI